MDVLTVGEYCKNGTFLYSGILSKTEFFIGPLRFRIRRFYCFCMHDSVILVPDLTLGYATALKENSPPPHEESSEIAPLVDSTVSLEKTSNLSMAEDLIYEDEYKYSPVGKFEAAGSTSFPPAHFNHMNMADPRLTKKTSCRTTFHVRLPESRGALFVLAHSSIT